MSQPISKTMTVTRVSYNTVEVEGGVPSFISQPDMTLRGALSSDRVMRILRDKHGKDATIVVTKLDTGRHEFEISFEDFIAHARIVDDPFAIEVGEDQEVLYSPVEELPEDENCDVGAEVPNGCLPIPEVTEDASDEDESSEDFFFDQEDGFFSVQDTSGFQKIGTSWW